MALDKKDIRRWVIVTLRNNGASEAQFPLPVVHNGIRVQMERDVPVIVPAFFLENVKNAQIPRFEYAGGKGLRQEINGAVKSSDDVRMVPVSYVTTVCEIPGEFQTLDGIARFEELLSDPKTAPAGFEDYTHTRIGPKETPPLSIQYDEELRGIGKTQSNPGKDAKK